MEDTVPDFLMKFGRRGRKKRKILLVLLYHALPGFFSLKG